MPCSDSNDLLQQQEPPSRSAVRAEFPDELDQLFAATVDAKKAPGGAEQPEAARAVPSRGMQPLPHSVVLSAETKTAAATVRSDRHPLRAAGALSVTGHGFGHHGMATSSNLPPGAASSDVSSRPKTSITAKRSPIGIRPSTSHGHSMF